MILAKLNQPEFEYDIHSLIKAFYPEQNVSATAEVKEYEEEILWRLDIDYAPTSIRIVLSEALQKTDKGFSNADEQNVYVEVADTLSKILK